jgi:hypothetical protein
MDLHLTFVNGSMTGDGVDDVGRFLIRGRYDPSDKECYWTKSYVRAHNVFYRGFREGKGIGGTWEITNFAHGGFHIWSRQASEGGQEAAAAEAEKSVDAIASEALTNTPTGTAWQSGTGSLSFLSLGTNALRSLFNQLSIVCLQIRLNITDATHLCPHASFSQLLHHLVRY